MSKWKNRFAFFEIRGRRFGVEISRVEHGGVPYLDRYILYIGGPTLRLHRFHRGDDDRAPHDHPWGFWTFPFSSYVEKEYGAAPGWYWNLVKARTWNWRPATYRHIVVGKALIGARSGQAQMPETTKETFWTFVVTTNYQRSWGFWPKWNEFVPWRKWPASQEQPDLLAQRPKE